MNRSHHTVNSSTSDSIWQQDTQKNNGNSAINKNAFEISSNEVDETGAYYTE